MVSASASDDDPAEHGDTGLIVAPEKPKLAKPPLWKVVMLNDDYTPMEFVVEVLQTFFGMNGEKACLLYTSPSPRDATLSRMPSSA